MLLTIHADVEISDDDIRDMIKKEMETRIHQMVVSRSKAYGAEEAVRRRIVDLYDESVDALIKNELANSVVLKERVTKEIEAKLRRQITALAKTLE